MGANSPTRGKRWAIVLAAGRASRMGALKQVLPVDGKPVVRRVVEAARDAALDGIVVVTGHGAGEVAEALAGLPIEIVHNPAYGEGVASSLKAGLFALPPDAGCAGVLLADQPSVPSRLIEDLVRAALEPGFVAAAVAYRRGRDTDDERLGRPGAPCALRASLFSEIMGLSGDRGAQAVLRRLGDRVKLLEVPDEMLIDLDTPEAYERLKHREEFRQA